MQVIIPIPKDNEDPSLQECSLPLPVLSQMKVSIGPGVILLSTLVE